MERIPRQLGITLIAQNNKDNIDIIKKHITISYIHNNYMYLDIPMNIETFSRYTNIDMTFINNIIIEEGKRQFLNMGIEDQNELHGATLKMALANALSDRGTALQQQNILLGAQQNRYIPFVSSEVTKAIKLSMESNTNILNVLSKMMGPGTSAITINNNLSQEQNQGLNVVQALDLIKAQADSTHSTPLLEDPNHQESLYMEYAIDDMPEVNATLQVGYDDSKEGLNIGKITDLISDEVLDGDSSEGHIDRRAKALDIDLDSDNI